MQTIFLSSYQPLPPPLPPLLKQSLKKGGVVAESQYLSYNLNCIVKVKLTDAGYVRLAYIWNAFLKEYPQVKIEERGAEYYKSTADAEGFIEMQLWDFIQKFGDVTYLGQNYYECGILIKNRDVSSYEVKALV